MTLHASEEKYDDVPMVFLSLEKLNVGSAATLRDQTCFVTETNLPWIVQFTKKCLICAKKQTRIKNNQSLQVGGFFVGSFYFDQDIAKLCIKFDEFEPGVITDDGHLSPSNIVSNTVISPMFLISNSSVVSNPQPFLSAINDLVKLKNLYEQILDKGNNNCSRQVKICTILSGTTKGEIFEKLAIMGSKISFDIDAVPIQPIPIIHTALVKSLRGCENIKETPLSGFITVDEKGNLMLLLDTDPKIYQLPIFGVWVKGVKTLQHPILALICFRFLNSTLLSQRMIHKSFVLIVYRQSEGKELFFQCKPEPNTMSMFSSCTPGKMTYSAMTEGTLQMHIDINPQPWKVVDLIQVLTDIVGKLSSHSHPNVQENLSKKNTYTNTPFLTPSVPEPSLIMEETEIQNYLTGTTELSDVSFKPFGNEMSLSSNITVNTKSTQTESLDVLLERITLCPNCNRKSDQSSSNHKVSSATQTEPFSAQHVKQPSPKTISNTSKILECEMSMFSSQSVCTNVPTTKSHVLSLPLGASASTCDKKQDEQHDEDFFVETLLKQVNAVLGDIDFDKAEDQPQTSNRQSNVLKLSPQPSLVGVENCKDLYQHFPSFTDNSSELSMHANAIALKYLSDKHLSGLHAMSPMFGLQIPSSNLQELCEESIMANNLSCATKQYLHKYGLVDVSDFSETDKSDTDLSQYSVFEINEEKKHNLSLPNEEKWKAPLFSASEQLSADACCESDKENNVSAGDTVKEILHPYILQNLNHVVQERQSQQCDENQMGFSQTEPLPQDPFQHHKRSNSTGRILSSQFLNLLAEKQTRRLSTSPKLSLPKNTFME